MAIGFVRQALVPDQRMRGRRGGGKSARTTALRRCVGLGERGGMPSAQYGPQLSSAQLSSRSMRGGRGCSHTVTELETASRARPGMARSRTASSPRWRSLRQGTHGSLSSVPFPRSSHVGGQIHFRNGLSHCLSDASICDLGLLHVPNLHEPNTAQCKCPTTPTPTVRP